jgi:hypothetical protein
MKRYSTLKRGGPLKRTTRLKKVSKKRAREGRAYSLLREAFLEAHPICQKCGNVKSEDIHHKAGRYEGNYLNTDTWAALCRWCHDLCHRYPKEAREQGWLQ